MKHGRLLVRIWMDIIGLVVPSIVIAAYLLGWSSTVRTVLTAVCFAGVFGTWIVTTDLRRWRTERAARWRRLLRRFRRVRA
jgi:uncharacterized membrane protein YraQ (UPF0718 family)